MPVDIGCSLWSLLPANPSEAHGSRKKKSVELKMLTTKRLFRSQSERVVGSAAEQRVVVIRMSPTDHEHHQSDRNSIRANDGDVDHVDKGNRNKDADQISAKVNKKMKRSSSKVGGSRFKLNLASFIGVSSSGNNNSNGKNNNKQFIRTSHGHDKCDHGVGFEDISGSTPVLLSVKKKSCCPSDSGCGSESPGSPPRRKTTTDHKQKNTLGFLRLFKHKSAATLLLPHPTAELNPRKPYFRNARRHAHHSNFLACSASSSSSLNSSVLHRNLEHDEPDQAGSEVPPLHSSSHSVISSSAASSTSSKYDSGAYSRTSSPESSSTAAVKDVETKKVVVPSEVPDLPPDMFPPPRLYAKSKSITQSTLALYPPLSAPSLVLDALSKGQRRRRVFHHHSHWDVSSAGMESELDSRNKRVVDKVDADHILSCLSAASMSSNIEYNHHYSHYFGLLSPEDYCQINCPSSILLSDVSVTLGQNSSKLTISQPYSSIWRAAKTNLRRTRSGLPLLGTACLSPSRNQSSGPVSSPQRSKISTVSVTTSPIRTIARSESFQMIRSRNHVASCCSQTVTVNGQHHCCGNNNYGWKSLSLDCRTMSQDHFNNVIRVNEEVEESDEDEESEEQEQPSSLVIV